MQNIKICIVRAKLICTVLIFEQDMYCTYSTRVYLDGTHTHIHHEFEMAEVFIPV
jgi:hypothetical protein